MGAESLLLIFLCVVYGYHALVLLFGTSHCLAIMLGEQQRRQKWFWCSCISVVCALLRNLCMVLDAAARQFITRTVSI
jgi:hypothetical protein